MATADWASTAPLIINEETDSAFPSVKLAFGTAVADLVSSLMAATGQLVGIKPCLIVSLPVPIYHRMLAFCAAATWGRQWRQNGIRERGGWEGALRAMVSHLSLHLTCIDV